MEEPIPDKGRFEILIAGGTLVGLTLAALRVRQHYDEQGPWFEESHVLAEISNRSALQILHGIVQDKSELHVLNSAVGSEDRTDGMLVTTQDGTTHRSYMLAGADEIDSRVRQLIAQAVSVKDPELAMELIQGRIFFPAGWSTTSIYHGYSAVAAAGVGGLPRWLPLEEGVLKQWSENGIFLMGDAVHKAMINPGLGGNLAIEDIAHFANASGPLLKERPMLSLKQLDGVFKECHTCQRPRADAVLYKFAAQYAKFFNGGPSLKYLSLLALDVGLAQQRIKE
ncbi:hypothetical protein BDW68DRAFT_189433 [Aspergillus falconensis]